MKSGRGYVIRFYYEKEGESLYYCGDSSLSNMPILSNKLIRAIIYFDQGATAKKVVEIKKAVKKKYKKGYLYISKVFYKEVAIQTPINKTVIATKIVPFKLTKPDRNDFLKAI